MPREHPAKKQPAKPFAAPQPYTDEPRPPIALEPVVSSQVAAIGYDEESQTLAVTFTRGSAAIYHYPLVSPDQYLAFKTSDSIGTHFGKHIKQRPFKKYPAEPVAAATTATSVEQTQA
jgi:hypothetical protein